MASPVDKSRFEPAKEAQDIAASIAALRAARQFAHEFAEHRRAMFLAYLDAGFTEGQALDLAAKAMP